MIDECDVPDLAQILIKASAAQGRVLKTFLAQQKAQEIAEALVALDAEQRRISNMIAAKELQLAEVRANLMELQTCEAPNENRH